MEDEERLPLIPDVRTPSVRKCGFLKSAGVLVTMQKTLPDWESPTVEV